MNISPNGIQLIQHFEKCKLQSYQDGGGVWTIGWGETHGVGPNMTWTQKQADEALVARLFEVARGVTNMVVARPINQYQFDALGCFAYNVGAEALRTSTLLKKLLAGAYAADEFCRWVHDNGVVVPGLVIRRACERMLFKGNDWRQGI